MNEKLLSLKDEIKSRLGETQDLTDLDKIRVSYQYHGSFKGYERPSQRGKKNFRC